MPPPKIFLTAVMANRDGKRVWTGVYACSACGQRFLPDPVDAVRLSREFSIHKDLHDSATETNSDVTHS
jgi:hypothetical protein